MYLEANKDDIRIAWLTALAIAIHMVEAAFPSPLPGIKPGLANVITILVLIQFGWRAAAWVSLLRVLVSSLLLGTFLSPTFVLSLCGAVASIIVLVIASRLPGSGAGPVGLGISAALAHMAGQFYVSYHLFIPHSGLLRLLPILMTAALIFGLVSGIIARMVLQQIPATAR